MKKYNDFYINSSLFIFLFILLSVTNLNADDRYYLHSKVFQNINNDKSLEDVVNLWVNFLNKEDETIRKSYWDSQDIASFQDDYCLFCNSLFQFPRETFLNVFKIKPYIVSIEQNENTYYIKTIFTQTNIKLSDSSIKNQNPAAIINVAVIRKGDKLFLKNVIYDKSKKWTQYKLNNINYFVEPSLAIDTNDCVKAKEFCDSVSHLWYGKKFSDTINYFVAPTSESIESLIELEFAYLGSFSGKTLINARIILDGT